MATGWHPVLRIPTAKEFRIRWDQFRTDVRLAARKRAYWRRGGACPHPAAAFVVGAQRSGTDMLLWRLDRSLDVQRYDENSRAAFRDCRIRDKAVRERLIAKSRARRVIFKPVCDSHRTAELLRDHPGSRAIWVYRDFRDVANSAVKRWRNLNLEWVRELAAGRGDWGRRQWNREPITPERQRQIEEWCDAAMNPHTAAAVFWCLVNQIYLSGLISDPDVTLLRYESLVRRPAPELSRLCRFLDVSYSDEMIEGIFASSVRRRSRAPISPPVEAACEQTLQRLDEACARFASASG